MASIVLCRSLRTHSKLDAARGRQESLPRKKGDRKGAFSTSTYSRGYMNIRRLCKTRELEFLWRRTGDGRRNGIGVAQLFFPEACEHLRFDIAAADDCNIQLGFGEFFGVEDETGGCNCAARFS